MAQRDFHLVRREESTRASVLSVPEKSVGWARRGKLPTILLSRLLPHLQESGGVELLRFGVDGRVHKVRGHYHTRSSREHSAVGHFHFARHVSMHRS